MFLTIKHLDNSEAPFTFCLKNGEYESSAVILDNPMDIAVERFDNLSLKEGLRWYLEDYPSLYTHVDEIKAEAVTDTLRHWGSKSFNLFFDKHTNQWYQNFLDNLEQLHLCIESESPEILSWPWEALCTTDSEKDRGCLFLGTHCSIERRISSYSTHWHLQERPEHLRMLMVIARPFGNQDVDFHVVSRTVVDYVRDERCPVEIDLLRPPTFNRLCSILSDAQAAGRPYHIVHFDGHGAEGYLYFETEPNPDGTVREELVDASHLAQALQQCGVSTVLLNACQSATVDDHAKSAYASVASSLLLAGIPSVTAMGYKLYVSGAKLFVPAFYQRLFRDGTPTHAMREGHSAMFSASEDRSPCHFHDWLVPQLYQSVSEEGRLLPEPMQSERVLRWENLHLYNPGAGLELDKYGLFGRGRQILELERLLRRPQAGILVYGMAGAGKTTLVRGFLRWLRDTGGLQTEVGSCPVTWFDFRDQFSSSGLFHYLASELMPRATAQREADLEHLLQEYLRQNKVLVVWDNFESVQERMEKDELARLRDFLNRLEGGETKVLITSRTKEDWLGTSCVRTVGDLPGLEGDALWDFCRAVAGEWGFTISPTDEDLRILLSQLAGNPLSIRAVLSRLGECSPAELSRQFEKAFEGHLEEEGTGRLLAAFQVVQNAAGPELRPVLEFLGLHEHFVNTHFIKVILETFLQSGSHSQDTNAFEQIIHTCFSLLERAGLCTPLEKYVVRIHPALRSCLKKHYPASEEMQRIFVRGLCSLELCFRNTKTKRQQFFRYYDTNISHALALAKLLDMKTYTWNLMIALAIIAGDRDDYRRAESLWAQLADMAAQQENVDLQYRAYSRLGILSSYRGDEETSKIWFQRAADLSVELLKQHGLTAEALTDYGNAAFQNWDLATAKDSYEKALEQFMSKGDSRAVQLNAILGNMAIIQDTTDEAERRLQQFLSDAEKQGDLELQAYAHASIAYLYESLKNDRYKAVRHYREAASILHQLHNRQAEADILWMLGNLYNNAGKYRAAKKRFQNALVLLYQLDRNQVGPFIARCYNGLGEACENENRTREAKLWYKEALKFYNRYGDKIGAYCMHERLKALKAVQKKEQTQKKRHGLTIHIRLFRRKKNK